MALEALETQALLAPEAPETQAVAVEEDSKMQVIVAEEGQALPAQDESSGSSESGVWVEPEDPHPPEKWVRSSSPNYDLDEEVLKRSLRRRKKTCRVMEERSVSAAGHSEEPKAEPMEGPSESEPET